MLETLQGLYDSLPTISCQGKCQQACGPVGFFPAELQNLKEHRHSVPTMKTSPRWGDLTCSALVKGRCSLYEQRPLNCRLFGIAEAMPCPFGCVPDRWLPEHEARAIMDAIAALQPGAPHLTIDDPPPSILAL